MKTGSILLATVSSVALLTVSVNAATILGTGAGALVGMDLTDQDDVHDELLITGFDATFTGNEEPGFNGAELAFNIFDNAVGGGTAKWCCGSNAANLPFWVDATFDQPVIIDRFTLTSSNDSPTRDPRAWRIQGTNDGISFTDIYVRTDTTSSDWTARNQVISYSGPDGDTFLSSAAFTTIRYQTDATGATTGAFHALNEVEYFGTAVPEPSSAALIGLAGLGLLLRRRL